MRYVGSAAPKVVVARHTERVELVSYLYATPLLAPALPRTHHSTTANKGHVTVTGPVLIIIVVESQYVVGGREIRL